MTLLRYCCGHGWEVVSMPSSFIDCSPTSYTGSSLACHYAINRRSCFLNGLKPRLVSGALPLALVFDFDSFAGQLEFVLCAPALYAGFNLGPSTITEGTDCAEVALV